MAVPPDPMQARIDRFLDRIRPRPQEELDRERQEGLEGLGRALAALRDEIGWGLFGRGRPLTIEEGLALFADRLERLITLASFYSTVDDASEAPAYPDLPPLLSAPTREAFIEADEAWFGIGLPIVHNLIPPKYATVGVAMTLYSRGLDDAFERWGVRFVFIPWDKAEDGKPRWEHQFPPGDFPIPGTHWVKPREIELLRGALTLARLPIIDIPGSTPGGFVPPPPVPIVAFKKDVLAVLGAESRRGTGYTPRYTPLLAVMAGRGEVTISAGPRLRGHPQSNFVFRDPNMHEMVRRGVEALRRDGRDDAPV